MAMEDFLEERGLKGVWEISKGFVKATERGQVRDSI